MVDTHPSNGGELQRLVLLAAVLARHVNGDVARLADLPLTRDDKGRIRIVADVLAPAMMSIIGDDARRGGAEVVFLTRAELAQLAEGADAPVAAVRLHAPETIPIGIRIAVSVSGFRGGTDLPLETLAFDFVPDGESWRLGTDPQHLAT